jgi:TetR/AcrR family transcriptional repressor of nem operon
MNMRYSAEHKEETRNRVLAEASEAIRANGPHRVGVAEIMRRAGLTHGGFYAHFRSKDALIAAAITTMFESSRERVMTKMRGHSAADCLRGYIDYYLSDVHRDALSTGCPIAALASELPRLSAASRSAFGQGVRRLTDLIAGKLAELGRDDPAVLASSVVAELVGALSLARAEPERAHATTLLAASRRALRARLGLTERP